MKVLLTIWISVVLIQEVVPSTLVRRPRSAFKNTSLIHTEYEAKYEQKGKHGNQSLSTVTGNQKILHDNCSENWNAFADKCASLIKDLISTLANAVQSKPGDATNLQLHIRNTFRHFDSTNNCTCLNGTEDSLSDVNVSPLFQNITIHTIPPGSNIIQASGNSQCSGQSCGGNSGSENVVVVDPAALSQQIKPSSLSENADVNPSNAAVSNDDSTNNSRRQVEYPRILKQPQTSFKNSAPPTGIAQRLTSKLPQINKSSVPPFLVTPLPNLQPAKPLQVPVVPSTINTGNGAPVSASQVLASPSNGNTASKNSVPEVLVKPQKSSNKAQVQNNLENAQPLVAVPSVSPVKSDKNSVTPNNNLKPTVILPVPKNTNFLPPVVVPAGLATENGNTQSFSSVPVINSNSNLPESPDTDCDDEESKSQSPINVSVPTASNPKDGILTIPASNIKQPVPKPNSISEVKIIPPVLESANQKAGISAVPVTNLPTGEGDDCEEENSAAKTIPVVSVPVATGIGPEELSDDTTAPVNTDPVQIIPAVPSVSGDSADMVTPAVQGQSDPVKLDQLKEGILPAVLIRGKPTVVVPTDTAQTECEDEGSSQNVTPPVVLPKSNENQVQGALAEAAKTLPPSAVVPTETAETECEDGGSSLNVTPPVVPPKISEGQVQGALAQAAKTLPPSAVVPTETECEDEGSNLNVTPPVVPPKSIEGQVQGALAQAAKTLPPAAVVPTETAETECEDEGSSLNVTPTVVPPKSIEGQVQGALAEAAKTLPPSAVVPTETAETECEDDGTSLNVTPPVVPPKISEGQVQGALAQAAKTLPPSAVVPTETECEDEGSNLNVTPPVVPPKSIEGQVQGALAQAAKTLPPSPVVPTETAETECEDEGSNLNVTPPVVPPKSIEGQVQGALAQAAKTLPPSAVVPTETADTECEDEGSSQSVTPPVVPPKSIEGQVHGALAEATKTLPPSAIVPIETAETECEDEGSNLNVTPPVFPPKSIEGQVQGALAQAAKTLPPSAVVPTETAETECEDEGSSLNVTPSVFPKISEGQVQGALAQAAKTLPPAAVVPTETAETECEDEGSSQSVTPPVVLPNIIKQIGQNDAGVSRPNTQSVIPDKIDVIPNQPDVQEQLGVTPKVMLPAEPIITPNSIGQVGQRGNDDPVLIKPTTFQTTSVVPTLPPSPIYLPPTESPVAPTNPSVPKIIKGTSPSKPTTSQAHHDDDDDDDEEDCCSCESCTEEEITDPKQYKENACKNLEEARLELKKIFDKIRKKLKCGRKAPQTITTSLSPLINPK